MGKYPFYIRFIRFIGWYAFLFYLWANDETLDSYREGMYWDERGKRGQYFGMFPGENTEAHHD